MLPSAAPTHDCQRDTTEWNAVLTDSSERFLSAPLARQRYKRLRKTRETHIISLSSAEHQATSSPGRGCPQLRELLALPPASERAVTQPAPAATRAAAFPAQITHTGQHVLLWSPYLILIKTRHFHLVSHCNYSPASWGRFQRAAPHEVWPAVHPPPWQGPRVPAVGFAWPWVAAPHTQPGCRAQLSPGQ